MLGKAIELKQARKEQYLKIAFKLLKDGIKNEIFQPSLGFNEDDNTLNLHQDAVLQRVSLEHIPCVSIELVKVLLEYFKQNGVLKKGCRIIVGWRGNGVTREVVEGFLRKNKLTGKDVEKNLGAIEITE